MTATSKEKHPVTLPEGVSLQRVGEVLRDAWEADPRRWMKASTLRSGSATEDGPPQMREDAQPRPATPVPQDALDLFRLLHERHVDYLLVGGMAMLTYVKGRNTKDVDLLMSVAALERLPELKLEDRNDFFARGKFKSIQVDLLLTKNPLFKIVAQKCATQHSFEELTVPTATVEGMILLKLFALPSLYRQFDWERIHVYESDIKTLLALHKPTVEPIFALLEKHILPMDLKELKKIVSEEQQRIAKVERGTQS